MMKRSQSRCQDGQGTSTATPTHSFQDLDQSEGEDTEEELVIECRGKKYTLLSQLDGTEPVVKQLSGICRQNFLVEWKTEANGNVQIRCPEIGCPVGALYIAQEKAVYSLIGREHNHPLPRQECKDDSGAAQLKTESSVVTDEFGVENGGATTAEQDHCFVDRHGKLWRFLAQAFNENHMHQICERYGLVRIPGPNSTMVHFRCKKSSSFSHGKGNCRLRAVFVKAESILYAMDEHNHPLDAEEKGEMFTGSGNAMDEAMPEEMDLDKQEPDDGMEQRAPDYVDKFGKHWRFHSRTDNEQQLRRICQQNGLVLNESNNLTAFYKCNNSGCPFSAIFIKFESNLYATEEHNHLLVVADEDQQAISDAEDSSEIINEQQQTLVANGPKNTALAYVDKFGKYWPFFSHVQNQAHLTQLCQQNGLRFHKERIKTTYFMCRKFTNIKVKCQFRAILVKAESILYSLNEHNHPVQEQQTITESDAKEEAENHSAIDEEEREEGFEKEDEEIAANQTAPNNTALTYVDRLGKHWLFFLHVQNQAHLSQLCQQNGLRLHKERIKTTYFLCRKSQSCQFRAILVKAESILYTMDGHNHPIQEQQTITGSIENGAKEEVENLPTIDENEEEEDFDEEEEKSAADQSRSHYVDCHRKHWRFLSRVNNEQHLQQVCQQHWLYLHQNASSANYYRCKMCSAFKRWNCSFRAILVKAESTLYAREEHNHPVEAEGNALSDYGTKKVAKSSSKKHQAAQSHYVDHFGKHWPFFARIESEKHLYQTCEQIGIRHQCSKIATIYFICQRKQSAKCNFNGIYVKADSTLYVHGEHNHPAADEKQQKISDYGVIDDYTDQYGKIWHFFSRIHSEEHLRNICREQWLIHSSRTESQMYFLCKCSASYKHRRPGPNCPMRALYHRIKGSIFLIGEHNHSLGLKIQKAQNQIPSLPKQKQQNEVSIRQSKTDDYTDQYGKLWHFFSRIYNEEHLRNICRDQWLYHYCQTESRTFFICKRSTSYRYRRPGPNCQLRAVYHKSRGSIFLIGQHSHSLEKVPKNNHSLGLENQESQIQISLPHKQQMQSSADDYTDKNGKVWHFFLAIHNEEHLRNVWREQWLVQYGNSENRTFFICKRSASYIYRRPGPNCPVRAVYHRIRGSLFFIGQHNHSLEKAPKKARNSMSNNHQHKEKSLINAYTTSKHQFSLDSSYVDQRHQEWRLLAKVRTEEQFKGICHQNWLIRLGSYGDHVRLACRKRVNSVPPCKFRARFFDNKIYVINEHNHPLAEGRVDEEEPKEEELYEEACEDQDEEVNEVISEIDQSDYVDRFGKHWNFLAKVDDEEELRQLCYQNSLTFKNEETLTKWFHCMRATRFDCNFRARFLKANRAVYVFGKHNHSLPLQNNNDNEEANLSEEVEEDEEEEMEEEEEKMEEEEVDKSDYVDRFGKHWNFLTKVEDEEGLQQVCRQNLLSLYQDKKLTRWFQCMRKKRFKCKYRAMFLKANRTIYVICRHSHSLQLQNNDDHLAEANLSEEDEEEKMEEEELEKEDEQEEEVDKSDYVDRFGKHWRFFAKVKKEEVRALCAEHWLFINMHYKNSTRYVCRRSVSRCARLFLSDYCQFRATYVNEKSTLYILGEHNHPLELQIANEAGLKNGMEKDEEVEEDEKEDNEEEEEVVMEEEEELQADGHKEKTMDLESDFYVDQYGKQWRFFAKVTEEKVREFCRGHWLLQAKNWKSTIHFLCRRSPSLCAQRFDCQFRATFVKAKSALYVISEHNHSLMKKSAVIVKGNEDTAIKAGCSTPAMPSSTERNEKKLVQRKLKQFFGEPKQKKRKTDEKEEENEKEIVVIDDEEKEEDKGKAENLDNSDVEKIETDEENTVEEPAPVYVDDAGNRWDFLTSVAAGFFERHYPLLGLQKSCESSRWALFVCAQRFELRCKFLLLLFKHTGLLYQRYEHSHPVEMTPEQLIRGKTPSPRKKEGEDGRMAEVMEVTGWKLVAENMHSEADMEELLAQKLVGRVRDTPLLRWYKCGRCRFRLRWLKRRGEVWELGAHSKHPTGKAIKRRLKMLEQRQRQRRAQEEEGTEGPEE